MDSYFEDALWEGLKWLEEGVCESVLIVRALPGLAFENYESQTLPGRGIFKEMEDIYQAILKYMEPDELLQKMAEHRIDILPLDYLPIFQKTNSYVIFDGFRDCKPRSRKRIENYLESRGSAKKIVYSGEQMFDVPERTNLTKVPERIDLMDVPERNDLVELREKTELIETKEKETKLLEEEGLNREKVAPPQHRTPRAAVERASVFWGFSVENPGEEEEKEEWEGLDGGSIINEERKKMEETIFRSSELWKEKAVPETIREPMGKSVRDRYIIGKFVGEDLLDEKNHVLLRRGEPITVESIEKAERAGALAELIIKMTLRNSEA